MKAKTLQNFKDEIAQTLANKSWEDVMSYDFEYGVGLSKMYSPEDLLNKAAEHYAAYAFQQGAEAQKKDIQNSLHKIDDGRVGCTYSDTEYDSCSVCYGYNNAIEDSLMLILNAPFPDNPYSLKNTEK